MRVLRDFGARYHRLTPMPQGWNGARYRREAGMMRRSAEKVKDHGLRRQLLQIAGIYERLAKDNEVERTLQLPVSFDTPSKRVIAGGDR